MLILAEPDHLPPTASSAACRAGFALPEDRRRYAAVCRAVQTRADSCMSLQAQSAIFSLSRPRACSRSLAQPVDITARPAVDMCREIEGDRGRSPPSCGFGVRGTGAGSADRCRSIFCESSAMQSEAHRTHRTPSVAARWCVPLDALAKELGVMDGFCKLGSRERVGSAIQAADETEEA